MHPPDRWLQPSLHPVYVRLLCAELRRRGFSEAEILQGTLSTDGEFVLDLATTDIGRTDSAKEVDALRRWFRLDGDTLSYNVRMAAVGIPLRHHLAAVLHRKDA